MYMKVENIRTLNVKIYEEGNPIPVFTGMIEDAPVDIRKKEYKSINVGNPTILMIWGFFMVNEIRDKIHIEKEKLEYLIFRYGVMNKKVLKQSEKLDDLIIDFYKAQEKLHEGKIIYFDFENKKVI